MEDLQRRASQNHSLPYVFPPSQEWLGNDGLWSTFIIRLGTPSQDFRILPATSIQETWVPLSQACSSSDFAACVHSRGIVSGQSAADRGFQLNQSTSWAKEGIYNLLSEANLGYAGNGEYGFDTVRLGPSSLGGPTLSHQVVAGIVTSDFYLGTFGLGPKPANFSDYNSPIPSYMRTLVDENMIPSLSYGYTAGARYRLDGVPGSLTLGGYDQARLSRNNVSFSFGSDDSRRLTLAIQSITVTNTLQGDVTPLDAGILSLIDSTVPHIWLPLAACQIFESAFGLIYDNNTDLYLINETVHAHLKQLNPTVTLQLGNAVSGGDTVSIDLPYGAFDLQASAPIYHNTTNYFPLRRAANESQYTLGRTFLQEAYVVADYERLNFSVSQTVFRNDNTSHIITIPSLNDTTSTEVLSKAISSRLNSSQIAGLVVGVLAILILGLLGGFLFWRHVRRNFAQRPTELPAESSEFKPQPSEKGSLSASKSYTRDLSTASTAWGELPAYNDIKNTHPALRPSKPQELVGSPIASELESPNRSSRSPTIDEYLRAAVR